ncbi:MAG: peptidylprolyl isomerase [Geminicoccaceae bacterium]
MRRSLMLATAVAMVLALPALAQTPPDNPVVAKVNGKEIRREEVMIAYQSLPDQYKQMPMEMLFDPLLQRVIDTQLLADMAERDKLADDPAVQVALERAREGTLRDAVITKAVTAGTTPEALQAAYDKAKADPNFSFEEVHAKHILLDNEDAAKAVIVELDNGGDFTAIAKAQSKDPSAAQNGGDLGFFRKEAMVPEFANAAFAMDKGTYSKTPVKSQFGWHVILVEDKRTTVPTLQEKEAELRDQIARDIVTALLEQARVGVVIEKFNPDGSPKTDAPAEGAAPAADPAAPAAPAQ